MIEVFLKVKTRASVTMITRVTHTQFIVYGILEANANKSAPKQCIKKFPSSTTI